MQQNPGALGIKSNCTTRRTTHGFVHGSAHTSKLNFTRAVATKWLETTHFAAVTNTTTTTHLRCSKLTHLPEPVRGEGSKGHAVEICTRPNNRIKRFLKMLVRLRFLFSTHSPPERCVVFHETYIMCWLNLILHVSFSSKFFEKDCRRRRWRYEGALSGWDANSFFWDTKKFL